MTLPHDAFVKNGRVLSEGEDMGGGGDSVRTLLGAVCVTVVDSFGLSLPASTRKCRDNGLSVDVVLIISGRLIPVGYFFVAAAASARDCVCVSVASVSAKCLKTSPPRMAYVAYVAMSVGNVGIASCLCC